MSTPRYLWERARRFVLSFVRSTLAQGTSTFLWALIIISLAVVFTCILIETVRLCNTGFNDKTLWDWMDLLLVPAALGVGVWWLNRSEKAHERSITTDRLRETALQSYFDTMTELLLEHDSSSPEPEHTNNPRGKKLRSIARIRTLSILRGLGEQRKRQVLQFLYESELIFPPDSTDLEDADSGGLHLNFVNLKHADLDEAHLAQVFLARAVMNETSLQHANLEGAEMESAKLVQSDLRWANLKTANLSLADLRNANLQNSDLRGTILSDAILREAYLVEADLRGAALRGADFRDATLSRTDLRDASLEDADLRRANLEGAQVSLEDLNKARKLDDAIMPNGDKYGSKQLSRAS